jgi:glycosyltransferase involved in cell wall biosynthesis
MDAALRAQAAASSAAGRIHFTGRVPHSEVERYYALTEVMAYPRKKSRLTDLVTPLKPLEANAQMQLVAASDVGGHRELIRHGETGVLFAPDDPVACATALADLVDRRADWDAIRRAARNHVGAHHDWATNSQRYQVVYLSLLGKPSDSRFPAAA